MANRKQTIVARAVIIQRGKILLCQAKGKHWYYLPGGHVEAGEFVVEALDRELREEIGTGIASAVFIGAHDNRYHDTYTGPNQELGLIFKVRLKKAPKDREAHIRTEWVLLKSLKRVKVMPIDIMKYILSSSPTKAPFWMVSR